MSFFSLPNKNRKKNQVKENIKSPLNINLDTYHHRFLICFQELTHFRSKLVATDWWRLKYSTMKHLPIQLLIVKSRSLFLTLYKSNLTSLRRLKWSLLQNIFKRCWRNSLLRSLKNFHLFSSYQKIKKHPLHTPKPKN